MNETRPPIESTDSIPTRRWLWPGVLAVLGIAALSGGLLLSPLAAGARGGFMARHGHDPEAMRAQLDFAADWALDRIDADAAQQEQVKQILERAFVRLSELHGGREGVHEAIVAQLTAPTIDRDALERLRTEQLGRFEAASRQLTEAIADIAEVLRPDQRIKLAELSESFRGRHGRWH